VVIQRNVPLSPPKNKISGNGWEAIFLIYYK